MADVELLQEFIDRNRNLLIITGAGCSTQSGIPAYRDREGRWLAREPIKHQAFVADLTTRKRYWARSIVGWQMMQSAEPNTLHKVLVEWERRGRVELLVTQNVDGLHRRAGSSRLVELHGRVDQVVCLHCGSQFERAAVQQLLIEQNPELYHRLRAVAAEPRPDGDAEFGGIDFQSLRCPPCSHCGGDLMPDVVFFGGSVPKARVESSLAALDRADALLVLGSSLMVYSGFRFCRQAAEQGKPIALVNQGITRADPLASLKLESDCVSLVERLVVG
ncbi:NAD-dependent protein deacetylase [Halioxenophilus sp. WMMB6]|uniref:NAD-dependent protein deacetylase n=1 Tax=Halioxenophilus sp. WMMB6 TaxID=3073815 RepID=UPI00295F2CEF|nr:NAD-dependent protein deacetylase [Halioxenophilus sp. WMMB6]